MDDQYLEIIKFGNDILTVKASEIKKIDGRIIHLVKWMTETMHRAPGVGLAAPQVGKSIRLATVDISVGEKPEELLILINPRIIAHEESETDEEGCLSFPGYSVPISRYREILFETISLDGKEIRLEAAQRELLEETGYRAKCFDFLFSFYPSAGYSTEILHIYKACELSKETQYLDEDEFIETEIVKFDSALEMIRKGEIMDPKTITALLYIKAFCLPAI